jgi:hypothetical protein
VRWGQLRLIAVSAGERSQRQSQWQSTARLLLSVGLPTSATKKLQSLFVASVTFAVGRLQRGTDARRGQLRTAPGFNRGSAQGWTRRRCGLARRQS